MLIAGSKYFPTKTAMLTVTFNINSSSRSQEYSTVHARYNNNNVIYKALFTNRPGALT